MGDEQKTLLAFGEIMTVLGRNAPTLSKHPEYAKLVSDFLEKFVPKREEDSTFCTSCCGKERGDMKEEKTCGDCITSVYDHTKENECRRCSGIFCDGCLVHVKEEGNFYCRNCYQRWF